MQEENTSKTKINFSNEFLIDDEHVLNCPSCGGGFLRHYCVDVFERKDDKAKGIQATIAGENVNVDTNLENNPSPRRHGLRIHFDCENCATKSAMIIYQHKGQTYTAMETH